MKVLVSNDDGIFAPGVFTLVSVLKEFAQVMVVCPDVQRSGYGHSITVSKPLNVKLVELIEDVECYQVDGSPADCIKIAMERLCQEKPDLIITGMNAGANVGQDLYYSGTIGAAREGVLYGIPAIAFSLARDMIEDLNFSQSRPLLRYLFDKILSYQIPTNYLLNVNLPACTLEQFKGVRVVNPELKQKKFDFIDYTNPKGKPIYWLANRYNRMNSHFEKADYQLLKKGYVTISPVCVAVEEPELCVEIQKLFN